MSSSAGVTGGVAVYARVSTSEQSTAGHVERLVGYCQSRRWDKVEVLSDEGISGVRDSRPQIDDLRMAVRRGEISCVVDSKMGRLVR